MTALAATNVTVSISQRNVEDRPGQMRRVYADLTYGNGSLTYPTGGVPLPAKEQYGFKKQIVLGLVEQPPANGFIYKFDRTNHKLKMFTLGFTTSATGSSKVSTVDTLYYVENSAGADSLMLIPGASVADATKDIGPMIELPATIAPASVTVRMEFVGE